MKNIAVFISGHGSNLQAIIDFAKNTQPSYNVSLVISDQEKAYGLVRAQQEKIASIFCSPQNHISKKAYEEELDLIMRKHAIDYIFLAGFMRLLSPFFCEKWSQRLINIHPSLLPHYKGLNTHERVFEDYKKNNQKKHGATVHYVNEKMDEGEIIAQGFFYIQKNDTPETLKKRTQTIEYDLYPHVIHHICCDTKKDIIMLKNYPQKGIV